MKKFNAFTLAEVLITLGIIGVVAAMTIAALINNYQKHAAIIGLKKAYNTISNALQRAEVDYGPMNSWDITPLTGRIEFREKYLDPYFENIYQTQYTGYNSANISISSNANPSAGVYCIKDGMCYWTYSTYGTLWILVDINGPKGHNRAGRDIFYFSINTMANAQKKLLFTGTGATREQMLNNCNKTSNSWSNGQHCSGLIVNDGWKIDKDYPW